MVFHGTDIQSRRIYIEENAKVVAAAWGTEFIQFLAELAILHQADLKNTGRINSSFLHIILVQQLARQGIENILSSKQQRRPLPCLLYKSFFYGLDCVKLYCEQEWLDI